MAAEQPLPAADVHRILVLDRTEALAGHIRALADRFADAPKVASCTRVSDVAAVLEDDGPFDVLVAGPSLATRAGLARLRVIAEELPGMSIVLAFAHRPDAPLRDIVRVGAVDLLRLPVEDTQIVTSLERAAAHAQRRSDPALEVLHGAEAGTGTDDPRRAGTVYTVASATGGCGKTFYATNLAWFLHTWTGRSVCIVDLDLQFGEVTTALRLKPKYTVFDALQREATDEDDLQAHIEECTVEHDSGVHVLAAPRDPSEADRITPPDVTRIIGAVRTRFDYVIIDTPPALAETVLAAFDLSDLLYVMATLDLPSVRNMSVFLSTLERLRIDTADLRLVLNKAERDVGIDVEQVAELFPQGFQSVLPYAREVSRSINVGLPVIASSPQAEISRLLAGGMKHVLPEPLQAQVAEQTAGKRSGLRRLLRA